MKVRDMKIQGTNILLAVILVSGIALFGFTLLAFNELATSKDYYDLAEHHLELAIESLDKANELLAQEQHNEQ